MREMGVYHEVNFGAKMCSGKNVICLFRCRFCGVDTQRDNGGRGRGGGRIEGRETERYG